MESGLLSKLIRHVVDFGAICRRQWWSPQALVRWQGQRLHKMVAHAYENVPFHRRRMQALGLTPADVRSLDDLHKLPFSTKDEIRAGYPDEVVAAGYGEHNCVVEHTSGSTGERLDILHERRAFDYSMALIYRHYHEIGYRLWHRRAYVRWQPFTELLAVRRFGLARRSFVPLLEDPQVQVEMLKQIQPHFISSYPSVLRMIVDNVPAADLAAISPRVIMTNSEQLLPGEAQLFRDAFRCDVFDEYSTFEVYQIAFECREHRYHIVSENVIVEFIGEDGQPVRPGEVGEIVVTGLVNKAMPFIRYRTNDLASPSDERCPCGRGLPVMKNLVGRLNELMPMPGGRQANPIPAFTAMMEQGGIKEYQIVQKRVDEIDVVVVPNDDASRPALEREILAKMRSSFLDQSLSFRVVFADRIERGATGKRKPMIIKPAAREGH
jgi:phenylacetate-CoA ligase